MAEINRKIRVRIMMSTQQSYSSTTLLEREVEINVLPSEDMTKALQALLSSEYKQTSERMQKLPENAPVEMIEGRAQELIG